MPDSAYIAHVSGAFLEALHEAQAMIAAGQLGEPLVDVVRHARELHEIMVDELGATGEQAGGALRELGERLSAMERYLQEH